MLSQRLGEESESSTVARLLKAAHASGISLDGGGQANADGTTASKGTLEGFAEWLRRLGKRKKLDKGTTTLLALLTAYLKEV